VSHKFRAINVVIPAPSAPDDPETILISKPFFKMDSVCAGMKSSE